MTPKQSPKVDIIAVAKAAKVSPSTVSRSFNHPDLVNLATRKKIDRAVRKLGYIRNRAAQAMHGKRSATIGLIVPTINHAIFAEVIQAFSDAVEAEGFTILIASHGYDLEAEYAVLRKLLEHRVDGVALIGLDHNSETFQLLEQQGVPAIAIWNYSDTAPIACIGADNQKAGAMAAQHLLDLGHRAIGTVFPPTQGNDRAGDRLKGSTQTLDENGISIPEAWQSEAPYSLQQAKAAACEMLERSPRPTALLCGNDVIAQGVIYAALKLGLKVPDDLSVIGIGDFKGSEEMEPALTTIRIPAHSIGQLAGQEITRAIADQMTPPTRVECDVKLVQRATTRKV